MGDRARLDSAAARPGPNAVSYGHRERAIELHASDAFDRGARRELLAGPATSVTCVINDGAALASLPESQICRAAAFAFGFAAISRHRVVGPWLAPVGCTLGGPEEIARAGKMR